MIDYNAGSGDLDALTSVGAAVKRDNLTQAITLPAPGTYYVPIGSDQSPTPSMTALLALHLAWNAALAATITVESCNFPGGSDRAGVGPGVVSDFDAAGNWVPVSSAVNADVVGTGNTAAGNTVTAGGTNAGTCMYNLVNRGERRFRVKIVCTVGGTVRVNRRGKNAA